MNSLPRSNSCRFVCIRGHALFWQFASIFFLPKKCPLLSPHVLWCPLLSHSDWPPNGVRENPCYNGAMKEKYAVALSGSVPTSRDIVNFRSALPPQHAGAESVVAIQACVRPFGISHSFRAASMDVHSRLAQNADKTQTKCIQKRECEFSIPVTSTTYNFNLLKCLHFDVAVGVSPAVERGILPRGLRMITSLRLPFASFAAFCKSLYKIVENRRSADFPTDSTTLYQVLTTNQNRHPPIFDNSESAAAPRIGLASAHSPPILIGFNDHYG
jgi:hypothetical protein